MAKESLLLQSERLGETLVFVTGHYARRFHGPNSIQDEDLEFHVRIDKIAHTGPFLLLKS